MSHPGELIIGVIKRKDGWYWWTCEIDVLRDAGFTLDLADEADVGPFLSHLEAWDNICKLLKEIEEEELGNVND